MFVIDVLMHFIGCSALAGNTVKNASECFQDNRSLMRFRLLFEEASELLDFADARNLV